MAQKRMLDKKISVSEQVANLTTQGQLLFTWMIAHADDLGLLPYSARSIKGLVVPMNEEFTVESTRKLLDSMEDSGLIEIFEWEDDKFIHLSSFLTHQTLKNDRKPLTIAKNLHDWKTVDSKRKPVESQGSEVSKKGSKEVSLSETYKSLMQNKNKIGSIRK